MCFWKELKYAAVNSFLLTPDSISKVMRMEMRMVSGHLDQLPAHSVLHLKHVEEGVDQVLVNLGIRNIIIVLQLIGNCTCHWPRGGACLVVSG